MAEGRPLEILSAWVALVAGPPLGLMFAFLFGFLAALATGIAVAAADVWFGAGNAGPRMLNAGLSGGLMTLVVLKVVGKLDLSGGWAAAALFMTGAMSAAVCAWGDAAPGSPGLTGRANSATNKP